MSLSLSSLSQYLARLDRRSRARLHRPSQPRRTVRLSCHVVAAAPYRLLALCSVVAVRRSPIALRPPYRSVVACRPTPALLNRRPTAATLPLLCSPTPRRTIPSLFYYMAFWQKVPHRLFREGFHYTPLRVYSSRLDWKQLRPMILKRINARAKNYPLQSMIPVAYNVLKAREILIEGVFTLMKVVPIKSCKFCPEVYIGELGHQIKTCHGFKRIAKNQVHRWTNGNVNDILVPVEAFHLETMSQRIIKHDRRFDFDRVPAVLELCSQAGAEIPDNIVYNNKILDNNKVSPSLSDSTENISLIAQRTLEAWEDLRLGVKKLLLVYPAKVCEYCSEVHIGPSGHKARMCGVFKYESWRGSHLWKRAEVDDLVPPKVVWRRRPQDPTMLLDSGRGFYGHAPAVVELCSRAGARIPTKYFCMMKLHGLSAITPS